MYRYRDQLQRRGGRHSRNQGGTGNHWLLINLVGSVSNRDGFGARVRIVPEQGSEQHAFVRLRGQLPLRER